MFWDWVETGGISPPSGVAVARGARVAERVQPVMTSKAIVTSVKTVSEVFFIPTLLIMAAG